MSKQTYFYAVTAVFIIVGVLHLVRALYGWDLTIGGANVPIWTSWIVVFLAAVLGYNGFRFGRKM